MGRYTKFVCYLKPSLLKYFILINLSGGSFNIIKFMVLFRGRSDMHFANNDRGFNWSCILLGFKVQENKEGI
jgi:hypothetical protein